MSSINFPNTPAVGEVYEFGGYTYTYDGVKWTSQAKYNDAVLSQVAIANNVRVDEVAYLQIDTVNGIKYFFDVSTQTTYSVYGSVTGTIDSIGADVDGIVTLTVDGGAIEIVEVVWLAGRNGTNLLYNHNFLISSPDNITHPSSVPTDYAVGTQIFSGVFVESDVTGLTYINGRVKWTNATGKIYFSVYNTNGLGYVTEFTASVADFDGNPRTRGVSFAKVGNEYHVTVGTDALTDVGGNTTPLGSVKFEQGVGATRHEISLAYTLPLNSMSALYGKLANSDIRITVNSYYHDGNIGGGIFKFDSSMDKSNHNGGTVISPSVPWSNDLHEYLSGNGESDASGAGCWVRVMEPDTNTLRPEYFGYDDTYLSGMLSVLKIIEVCKEANGGTLLMPEKEFLLGGQMHYRSVGLDHDYVGSNFTWVIPTGGVVVLDGCFGLVWRPTGLGLDGGEKNFNMCGGGLLTGKSNLEADDCFLSLNFQHVIGVTVKDLTFKEVTSGHLLDLTGVADVIVKDCDFIGSCTEASNLKSRAGHEVIQIDSTVDTGRRYTVTEDNQYMDATVCSNLTFKNLRFMANRDTNGDIITHAQMSIGAHTWDMATIDKMLFDNIYVEQIHPDAIKAKGNDSAINIPACDNLVVKNIYFKTNGARTEPAKDNGSNASIINTLWKGTYEHIDSPSSSSDVLPTYKTETRLPPKNPQRFSNIIIDMTQDTTYSRLGRIFTSSESCSINNMKVYTHPKMSLTKRTGYDLLSLGRGDDSASGGASTPSADREFNITNVYCFGSIKNALYKSNGGRFVFKDCYIEGHEFSFRDSVTPELITLTLDNVTLSNINSPYAYGSAFEVSKIRAHNLKIDGTLLTSYAPTSGYIVNSVFNKAIPSEWSSIDTSGSIVVNTDYSNAITP